MSADPPPRRRRPAQALLAALAAALPLVPILIGISLTGRSAGRSVTPTTPAALYRPAPVPPAIKPHLSSLVIPPGQGTLVARLERPTPMRSSPGGPKIGQLGVRTQFGSPQVMWVASVRGLWLGVVSPQAGNGRLGWIPATTASLERMSWKLQVDLARRRLTVLQAGRVVESYLIAVGAPGSPTPTGRFDVTDRLTTGDPEGPYGCCILALSALAPHAIQGWTGGNRIAIHSTPETWTIGQPVSHGCMRLTLAEGRWLLRHIPLGTPALISAGPE